MEIPEHWKEEGTEPPSKDCIELVEKIKTQLLEKYNLTPRSTLPSIEGGIMLIFEKKGISLLIEVYNDFDIASLINNDKEKKIIFSVNISDLNFEEVINNFWEELK